MRRELSPWWLVVVILAIVAGGFIDGSVARGQETKKVPCLNVPIEYNEYGPYIPEQPYWTGGKRTGEVRYALVGHYVWFQWGHTDDPGENDDGVYEDTLSFDVSSGSIESVIGCIDGSVTIVETSSEPTTTTAIPPDTTGDNSEPEISDSPIRVESLEGFCETYGWLLGRYCGLVNRILTWVVE